MGFSGRPEERKILESLAKKTVGRREEAEILKEELNSELKKGDDIMNQAENLKKLDLDEAESNDTSPDAKRRKQGKHLKYFESKYCRNSNKNMISRICVYNSYCIALDQ